MLPSAIALGMELSGTFMKGYAICIDMRTTWEDRVCAWMGCLGFTWSPGWCFGELINCTGGWLNELNHQPVFCFGIRIERYPLVI